MSQTKCEEVAALPPLPHTKIRRSSSRAWARIAIAWFTFSRSTVSMASRSADLYTLGKLPVILPSPRRCPAHSGGTRLGSEHLLPGDLALGLVSHAAEQATQRTLGGLLRHISRFGVDDALEERFDGVDRDFALGVDALDQAAIAQVVVVRRGPLRAAPEVLEVPAAGFQDAVGADEHFADIAVADDETRLDGGEVAFDTVGVIVGDIVMVAGPVAPGQRITQSAGADGLQRVVASEPVHGVHAVAILFDDGAAGGFTVELPAADLLLFGREFLRKRAHEHVGENPIAHPELHFADFALVEERLGAQVFRAEALLETELNSFGGVGEGGGSHHMLHPGDAGGAGLLTVDVFLRLDGGCEMDRMQEDGRGNEHRVEVRPGEHFVEILVDGNLGRSGNGAAALFDAVVIDIADGRQLGIGVVRHVGADVVAATAESNHAEGHAGVGFGGARGFGGEDEAGGSGGEEGATSQWFHGKRLLASAVRVGVVNVGLSGGTA